MILERKSESLLNARAPTSPILNRHNRSNMFDYVI